VGAPALVSARESRSFLLERLPTCTKRPTAGSAGMKWQCHASADHSMGPRMRSMGPRMRSVGPKMCSDDVGPPLRTIDPPLRTIDPLSGNRGTQVERQGSPPREPTRSAPRATVPGSDIKGPPVRVCDFWGDSSSPAPFLRWRLNSR